MAQKVKEFITDEEMRQLEASQPKSAAPDFISDADMERLTARPAAGQVPKPGALGRPPTLSERAQEAGVSGALTLGDVLTGAGKGAEQLVHGGGQLLRNAPVIGPALSALPSATYTRPEPPSNLAQKVGYGAEKFGEFYLPSGAVGKLGEAVATGTAGLPVLVRGGINLGTRAALEGAATGGITGMQGGDVKTAAALGAASPIAGALASPITQRLPGAVINYALRPLQKQFRFGMQPGEGVAGEGIMALSDASLLRKLRARQGEIGQGIGSELAGYGGPGRTTIQQHLQPIDDAINQAATQNDQSLVNELTRFRKSITDKMVLDPQSGQIVSAGDVSRRAMTPSEAAGVKMRIGEGTQWSGAPYEKALNQAKADTYRSLRNRIEEMVPSVGPLADRYANVTEAINAAKRKETLSNILRFSDLLPIGVGVGESIREGHPGPVMGALGAAKMLQTTPGATITAQLLRKAPTFAEALRNYYLSQANPGIPPRR